ncbi:hypothetical protein ACIA8O_25395 [Kitasatospora sp. NPDC051853]|uniref:hypothetical protein n=1 Tax=Kitasatospora sp. NPDC051853 TaxID=3364058 RepID=UPI0037A3F4C3
MTGAAAHTTAAGWIWHVHLRAFLDLVARYVGHDFDTTDWRAVTAGLESTDDEHPDRWFAYPLVGSHHRVDVHLANAVGGEEVSVRVVGPTDGELALRVDTLMAAYASAPPCHHT